MAWSPDGARLATGGGDGYVKVWTADGQGSPGELRIGGWVFSVNWSPDGNFLAATGSDGLIKVWNPAGNQEPIRFGHGPVASGQILDRVTWNWDGTRLASQDTGGVIKLWRMDELGDPTQLEKGRTIIKVDWSKMGDRLASVAEVEGQGVSAIVWDAHGPLKPMRTFPSSRWFPGFAAELQRVAIGEEKGTMVTVSNVDGTGVPVHVQIGSESSAVSMSPDGKRLAASGKDGVVKIFDMENRRDTIELRHDHPLRRLVWSPDSTHIAVVEEGYSFHVWDLDSGLPPQVVTHSLQPDDPLMRQQYGLPATIWFSEWSPDSTRLATADIPMGPPWDSTLLVWEANSAGAPIRIGAGGRISKLAWSPDSDRLAVATSGMSDGNEAVTIFAFNPPHSLIRFGAASEIQVEGLAWSPDGKVLATAGMSGAVKLWPVDGRGQPIRLEYGAIATDVDWRSDGSLLAGGGHDGVRIWVTRRDILIDLLCVRAGRNLTKAEWNEYVDPNEPWRKTCPGWRNPEENQAAAEAGKSN